MVSNHFPFINNSLRAIPHGEDISNEVFARFGRFLSGLRRHDDAAHPATSADVARVRAFAYSLRDSDPGFAADLMAAADRYEMAEESRAEAH
jgi:hypothetical protein